MEPCGTRTEGIADPPGFMVRQPSRIATYLENGLRSKVEKSSPKEGAILEELDEADVLQKEDEASCSSESPEEAILVRSKQSKDKAKAFDVEATGGINKPTSVIIGGQVHNPMPRRTANAEVAKSDPLASSEAPLEGNAPEDSTIIMEEALDAPQQPTFSRSQKWLLMVPRVSRCWRMFFIILFFSTGLVAILLGLGLGGLF